MRIRKRFPPPSDPQLNRSVVVQLNTKNESLPSDLPNLSLPQPSDQPAAVTGAKTTTCRWVIFGGNNNNPAKLEQKDVEAEAEAEDGKLRREKKESCADNDNKKELSFLSTRQLGSLLPQPSSSYDLVDGRWCEEDHKVIPLRKRSRDNNHHNNNNTSNINTMKSKTNNKCPQENGNEEEQEHEEHYRRIININSDHKVDHVHKKNKRGSVILEGSRCSRVNGRGWRCCQQTLVGYSLCEHHLGKGRLRSMNSTVRNSMNNKKKKKKGEEKEKESLPNDYEYYGVDDDDEDDNKKKSSLMTTKKKEMKKLGMVKARSLSSLLGQTDNAVAVMVVGNNNKNE